MPVLINALENFASYNCLWTMACPTPGEVNSTAYRSNLNNVIFSSAGRYDFQRVKTAYGVPEYFVDNVEMRTFVGATPSAGNTSQITINFEIFEPFSLGLFLQSCQAAALNAGYKSYLDNAPYVIKLEFAGQTTTNQFETIGPYYFLVKLKKVEFSVNEGGSKYKVETFPYTHSLFNASINSIFTDVKLLGKTAKEVLVDHPTNSLIGQLNAREQQLVKDQKKTKPDTYAIEFVPCDWGGPNPFEPPNKGTLEFSATSAGGTEVYKRIGDVDGGDGKVIRGKMTINPKEKSLQFSQGDMLTNIIDTVILSTKEARENATDPGKFDGNGFITWWRLNVDIKLQPDYDEKIKDYAKQIIFRITPYKIHHSVFLGPEAKAQGVAGIKADLVKEYNYIYTGKNTDVVKFDIQINNLFFTAIDPNKAEDTAVTANPGINASVPPDVNKTEGSQGQAGISRANNAASAKPNLEVGKLPFKSGSGNIDPVQKIANEFYMATLGASKDMIKLNIELLGDPYWLPENGIGNYHPSGGGSPIADGTMNYETRDLYVGVNFRTPVDTRGADGLMAFQEGDAKSPFSGLYKVVKVEHRFSGNVYKTMLEGPRMPAQDVEGPAGDPMPTRIGEEMKDKPYVYDNPGE